MYFNCVEQNTINNHFKNNLHNEKINTIYRIANFYSIIH